MSVKSERLKREKKRYDEYVMNEKRKRVTVYTNHGVGKGDRHRSIGKKFKEGWEYYEKCKKAKEKREKKMKENTNA